MTSWIAGIGLPETSALLKGHPDRQRALAAFMARPLTDERVRFKRAPFDHPQIFVPNGHPGDDEQRDRRRDGQSY